jgi:hypothetical protein
MPALRRAAHGASSRSWVQAQDHGPSAAVPAGVARGPRWGHRLLACGRQHDPSRRTRRWGIVRQGWGPMVGAGRVRRSVARVVLSVPAYAPPLAQRSCMRATCAPEQRRVSHLHSYNGHNQEAVPGAHAPHASGRRPASHTGQRTIGGKRSWDHRGAGNTSAWGSRSRCGPRCSWPVARRACLCSRSPQDAISSLLGIGVPRSRPAKIPWRASTPLCNWGRMPWNST